MRSRDMKSMEVLVLSLTFVCAASTLADGPLQAQGRRRQDHRHH